MESEDALPPSSLKTCLVSVDGTECRPSVVLDVVFSVENVAVESEGPAIPGGYLSTTPVQSLLTLLRDEIMQEDQPLYAIGLVSICTAFNLCFTFSPVQYFNKITGCSRGEKIQENPAKCEEKIY